MGKRERAYIDAVIRLALLLAPHVTEVDAHRRPALGAVHVVACLCVELVVCQALAAAVVPGDELVFGVLGASPLG